MYARVTLAQLQPGKVDELLHFLRDNVVPAAQTQQGFKGLLLLTNDNTNKGIAIGLWETEADMVASEASDGYYTVYVHVAPTVAVGASVIQGQQIGVTDNSGCQSGGHIHMRRTDPSGTPVNFTIPCVNPLPKVNFADGVVNDDVPDL